MSFKCLMFTDLHFGVHNNDKIWLNSSLKLAEEMKNTCEDNNIKDIIFLGDFFHDRKSINSNTMWIAHEFFSILKDINLWMIIGNHDTYLKNNTQPHSLRSFENIENVNIIEDTYRLNDYITLISWNKSIKNHDTPYIAGHFDISGCELSSNFTESQETFKISDFKKYKQVFSGHFHSTNITKNIFYIGSVMPFTFADIDCKRGYYIVDFMKDDLKYEFIEFKHCPKYVVIDTKVDIEKTNIENNIIKILYDVEMSTVENEAFLNKIWEKKPLYVYTDLRNISIDSEEVSRTNITFKNTKDILYEYIDVTTVPDFIDKDELKKYINLLLEK